MSGNHFHNIMTSLRCSNKPKPGYEDKFLEVRQMIQSWNQNMVDQFVPLWILCLDESMCPWMSRWSCPGWMVVPRKPHPFENKYHTICCGETGIMYAIELVEGKDCPSQAGPMKYEEKSKTVGLMCHLTLAIHRTGKVVVMDSGFCVLDKLLELKKLDVCGSAVIKKHCYWPKYINDEEYAKNDAKEKCWSGRCNNGNKRWDKFLHLCIEGARLCNAYDVNI